jgi:hypothetical protein
LLDIATWHASDEEAVGAVFVLGDGKMARSGHRAAPLKATAKGARKGAKGGKKRQKRRPRWVAVATSDNDDSKQVDDSDEECVMTTERDFKRQA